MNSLDGPRQAISSAVTQLQAFSGTAGSTEMRQVQSALDYLGYAYAVLRDQTDNNPVWDND